MPHTPVHTCPISYLFCIQLFRINYNRALYVNPFTPTVSYGDIKVILTFESVNEILWCDHSNETYSPVLSHGTIPCLSILQNEIWDLP